MLPKAGHQCAQRGDLEEDILGKAGRFLAEYYKRPGNYAENEGAFGLLKNDFSFRRFMTTGKRNIRIELFFLALGFNLKKRWMKQQKSRLETHYSEKKAS